MKRAEQVTFGGSGLDRAAQLRSDPEALDALWHAEGEEAARVLLFWRGKPLCLRPEFTPDVAPEPTPETAPETAVQTAPVTSVQTTSETTVQAESLATLAATHDLVAGQRDQALFLGRSETGAGYFAVDISAWEPEDTDLSTLNTFLDPSEQQHPDLPSACVFSELRRVMTLLTPREAELATTAKAMLSWHDSHRFCARCGAPSRIEQAGWQRRCDSCSGAHFPRTDPVVIMLITRGDRVLLGRSPGWPEGMYSLLAGFVEPGETMEAAVRREVMEEAGVKVGAVAYLASQPWAFPMSLMLGCHGQALSDEIEIDPTEIDEAFWLSRQEVMDVFAGEHPKVRPPRKGAIAGFLLENWVADTLG